MSLANNVDYLRRFPKLGDFGALGIYPRSVSLRGAGPLIETLEFGSNPGALRMLSFVPDNLPRAPALVVVLHGCGQTSAGYDLGTGWSTLARHYGFALLMPEQRAANNAHGCFNWFTPDDVARGRGEAGSIRQMIARMAREHHIDPRRVYITGLSAGGAMTSAMLAIYPEVFAAGAIIAGLPFGIATNMREALRGMMHGTERSAPALGGLVRRASDYRGPWPRISVWHGSADRVVHPSNADAIVRQWVDVHGLPLAPMSIGYVDNYPREVWWNSAGETIVESYAITDMAHGTPLGLAHNDERYGEEGAFLIEAGISSSYHIASFFGLTGHAHQAAGDSIVVDEAALLAKPDAAKVEATPQPKPSATHIPEPETIWSWAKPNRSAKPDVKPEPVRPEVAELELAKLELGKPEPAPRRRGLSVRRVISRALEATGLFK